jgi:lipoate-protein ligase A
MLDVLPTRSDSAAANMAADFLLLKRYPDKTRARFRAYGWHRPAFSFGYSQKIAWVRANLPADADNPELVRRPSGGGLVDHRDDWTYALVIPRGHALEAARAVESYRAVHAALAEALRACGQPATLKESCEKPPGGAKDEAGCSASAGPTICFTRPELYDVVHPETGGKIAGAAQKRSKDGLLFQGSLLRPASTRIGDYDTLHSAFASALAVTLGLPAADVPWPEFPEGEHEALTEQYAATEWTEAR